MPRQDNLFRQDTKPTNGRVSYLLWFIGGTKFIISVALSHQLAIKDDNLNYFEHNITYIVIIHSIQPLIYLVHTICNLLQVIIYSYCNDSNTT